MKNALSAITWKRLTFAVVLSAAILVGILATTGKSAAKPITPACSGAIITSWYSDAALTHGWCQDVTTPCPGQSATHACDGSHTPYYKTICVTCYPN